MDSTALVCQEVLKTPVQTAAGQQVFCRKCFLTAVRECGIHCPLCRGYGTRRERARPERASDLENLMSKFSGSCRCCAKQIKFYRLRYHYKSCKKYQDEDGVSSIIPNFEMSRDSVGNSNRVKRRHLITRKLIKRIQVLGIPPLSVPCVKNQILLDSVYWIHCNSNHLFQIILVTCPICVSLPWGDPSQITRNFGKSKTSIYYGEFVNLQLDEETQYQTAVEESFQVNI